MPDEADKLTTDPGPNVDLLLKEFQSSAPLGEGLFDANFCENVRRNLWPGQSPDGRKWDEWQEDGNPAMPWNGSSDTRVPGVDGTINDMVALGMVAFRRAELTADTVNPETADLVGPVSSFLHWMVRKRYRRALELEAELSLQYIGEYGWCVGYVGWERELSKHKKKVTLEQLSYLASTMPEFQGLPQMILDETLDDESGAGLVELYKQYVVQEMAGKGFFEDELDDSALLNLKLSSAKRYVRELREDGKCEIPMPYVCKNRPLVYMCRPYHEFLSSRGTTDIQSGRCHFLRRTFTEAELEAKKAEGWDETWIEAAKKTKGSLSMWGNPSGQPTIAPTNMSPSKVVGGVRWYRLTQSQYDRIEVVYAFRRNVDENGVTEIYQTIFSPHITTDPNGGGEIGAFCAKHELLDDAHGEYPFEVFKRENLGRGLTESRSVSELGATWQQEEKTQRDMLFNRAQLETLPPIRVPKLGGVDYKLGPGAQIPAKKGDEFNKLIELGAPPTLSLEIIKLLRLQTDDYFGNFNAELPAPKVSAKQEKRAGDFFSFWGGIFRKMIALQVQYNPNEIVRVTGTQELGQLDPREIVEELDLGLSFDVMELDQEYLLKKLDVILEKLIPADASGEIDRGAFMQLAVRMLDSRLAQKILMDRGTASQKIFDDVMNQCVRMAQGNEAQYVENDPGAPTKLQFLQQIIQNNPKYQQALRSDQQFMELVQNYEKNLQMSVLQQQNKQVGRIGVKPKTGMGAA